MFLTFQKKASLCLVAVSSVAVSALSVSPRLSGAMLRVEGDPSAVATWYASSFEDVEAVLDDGCAEVVFPLSDFALRFSGDEAIKPYDPAVSFDWKDPSTKKLGFLGVGVEVSDASGFLKDDDENMAELELVASMIPDEDPAKDTRIQVAEMTDPAGFPVAAIAQRDCRAKNNAYPAPKLVVAISDLDASIKFYTNCLGMRLLRKRALLPEIPAMSGFVGFSQHDPESLVDSAEGADEAGTPRIELRYLYNSKKLFPDLGLGDIIIKDADPELVASLADAEGGKRGDTLDDGSIRVFDPDGYAFLVCPTTSSSSSSSSSQ